MNELIAAAKAVIEVWDAGRGLWDQISALRAAVERAEKQDTVGFEEWWVTPNGCLNKYECETSCVAAQQAERERIKDVVAELLDPKDPWIHYSTLLEKIDDLQ